MGLVAAGCGDDEFNGLPDAPDGDADSDGIPDTIDNCPLISNADQVDTDGDSQGDACDDDDDNDGVLDAVDNCPLVANPNQANADNDADGDACDGDADGDGVADASDNCPTAANADQVDTDADGLGDGCDDDDDNDTLLDINDNCPVDANAKQEDFDEDTLGDACDDDADNDSVTDDVDNCLLLANGDQSNLDGDANGDACDDDDDNDNVVDTDDNCPGVANEDQADANQNGHGDACDGVITPSLTGVIKGGNMVSVGAGFAGRWDNATQLTGSFITTSVDLVLAGIPAGASVVSAKLYWTVIGTPFPTVTFAGEPVTGVEVAQTPDTCWSLGNNFQYRADVTSQVTGNGTFTASDLLSAGAGEGPDGQGISLVVVYIDPADARNNFLSIRDGGIGLIGSSGTVTTPFGFTLGANFDKVTVTTLMADGQAITGTPRSDILVAAGEGQPSSRGGGVGFDASSGDIWDNRIDDVTELFVGGETSLSTTVDAFGDCLSWSMTAVVIEDIDAELGPVELAAPVLQPTVKAKVNASSLTNTPGTPGFRTK